MCVKHPVGDLVSEVTIIAAGLAQLAWRDPVGVRRAECAGRRFDALATAVPPRLVYRHGHQACAAGCAIQVRAGLSSPMRSDTHVHRSGGEMAEPRHGLLGSV